MDTHPHWHFYINHPILSPKVFSHQAKTIFTWSILHIIFHLFFGDMIIFILRQIKEMILERTYYISSRELVTKSPYPARTVNRIHALAALPPTRNIRTMPYFHGCPHLHIAATLAAHAGQQVAALPACHKTLLIFLI